MKRYAIPALAGVLVFTAVTGFAATLDVTSTTLGSGEEAVTSCNDTANVTYTTGWEDALNGYEVLTAPIDASAACANLFYKVTLTGDVLDGTGNVTDVVVLEELTGSLSATGTAVPDFSALNTRAQSVTGVAVVITNTPPA